MIIDNYLIAPVVVDCDVDNDDDDDVDDQLIRKHPLVLGIAFVIIYWLLLRSFSLALILQ